MTTLEGKVILVTGASRGIGAATAAACRNAGAKVLAHASRPGDAAAKTAAALGQAADDFLFEDLAAFHGGFRLVDAALSRAGRLDGIVNNAGTYTAAPLAGDLSAWDEGWATAHAVNVQAPADICRAAIGHFRQRGASAANPGGVIVNVASRAGHRGDGVEHASYAASKGAVLAMTKTWARGLAAENILLYAIAPGWVETRMVPHDVAARAEAVKDIPLGRVAQPEEVAALIAFLLSGASPSATGATFDVNGASYVR